MKKPTQPTTVDQIRKRLGQNIAQARKLMGLAQADLAEQIGVDPVSLSRIETGNSLPGIERIVDIADAMDVSIYQLLDGISQNVPDQVAEVGFAMRRLNAADRDLIVVLVKQLSERLAKK